MIPSLRCVFSLYLLGLAFASTVVADNKPASPIQVVTSFSILEDLVKVIGGEQVEVVNLVGRNSDAHLYQPKPADLVAISRAQLVVFNGLGFEGWISRLIENTKYKNTQLVASSGVNTLAHEGEIDPHAWQSFINIRIYINNITRTLNELRPKDAAIFNEREAEYLHKLDSLEKRLLAKLAMTPREHRIVVTSHDAFSYLGRELDIQFLAPVGYGAEVDATAMAVSAVINQVREHDVKAMFVENMTDPRLLQSIANDTGVVIGGRLYSDALSELGGPAGGYYEMMQHNIESLIEAFQY